MDSTPDSKKKEEEKKKGGFLANLVGKPAAAGKGLPGLGGLGGAGGSGGFGGLGGLFAGGGLLATKAGLIGALLVASAAAGGLGLLGYKLFGPSGADKTGSAYSLFSPRPAEEQRQIEAERAAADGRSASLDFLAKANAGNEDAKASEAQASEAVSDAAAANAKAAGSASAAVPKNSGDVTANKAAKLGAGKFGAMSKMSLGGGGGGGSSASMSAGGAQVRASGNSLSGMGGAAPRGGAATRGAARKGLGRSAYGQLGSVRRDQRAATSSAGAGSTYDGGVRGMGGGTTADAPGGTGVSDGANTPTPGGTAGDHFPDPPKPESSGWATPWQNAIKMASMAIMAGVALLFVAGKLLSSDPTPMTKALAVGLGIMAGICGALAIKMGAQIAGGEWGQKLQGGMFIAAGTALLASTTLMMVGAAMPSPPPFLNYIMVACGAAALGATAMAYLSKPKKYPPWKFQDGQPPDLDHKDQKSGEGGGGILGDSRGKDDYGWLKDQLPC